MNQIRAIQELNRKEIENGISPNASWHVDYRDTAYVYFGGLPYELSEGDIITIFSQFGEPTFLKLVRDKETGKSKGFGWLKYEDQRSTDLAVDNIGGAEVGGRLIRVDHARYQARDDEDQDEFKVGWEDLMRKEGKNITDDEESEEEEAIRRPMLPEEKELALLMQNHDDDDPMKGFLIEEKKKEVEEAQRRAEKGDRKHKHRHHHHRSHRSRRDDEGGDRQRRSRRDGSSDRYRSTRHREKESERSRRSDEGDDSYRRRRRDHEVEDHVSDGRRPRDSDRKDRDDRRWKHSRSRSPRLSDRR